MVWYGKINGWVGIVVMSWVSRLWELFRRVAKDVELLGTNIRTRRKRVILEEDE